MMFIMVMSEQVSVSCAISLSIGFIDLLQVYALGNYLTKMSMISDYTTTFTIHF